MLDKRENGMTARRIMVLGGALAAALVGGVLGAAPASADTGTIVYDSREPSFGQSDIWAMNGDGTNPRNLTNTPGVDEFNPELSPDGTKVVYSSYPDIWVMNADGSNQVPLTAETGYDESFSPTWSPDGQKVAFTSTRDGDWEIFVMNADGSNEINVTGPNQSLAYDDLVPDWSPDGTRIVFQGVRDGAQEILSMNPDGTGEINLTSEDVPAYANTNGYASYSPSGAKILYHSQPNNGSNEWDIWVMNADGTAKQNVVPDDDWQDLFPSWSPDGTQIVFSSNRSTGSTDLYVTDYVPTFGSSGARDQITLAADGGTSVRRLTSQAGDQSNPHWVGGGTTPPPGVRHTLTVTKAGSGAGSVTSSPAGISCGTDCTESYAQGTAVTLTARPGKGVAFGGWSGACTGTALTCTVTMSAAKSVSATFGSGGATPPPPSTYALQVTKGGSGSGTVVSSPAGISCGTDCTETYASGTQVTLTAQPGKGVAFGGWSGDCTGTGLTCTVTMSAARSVTATFGSGGSTPPQPSSYTLTVTRDGSGSVVSSPAGISCGTDCTESYASGTQVTLTARAGKGTVFVGWSGACAGTAATCVVTMNAAKGVTAAFRAA